MENLNANLNGSTLTNMVKNLTSGEELFFVDAHRISYHEWHRNPCMKKEEAIELTEFYLMHPDFKDVNMFSENFLNKSSEVWNYGWEEGLTTNRESIFGCLYQDVYESLCKDVCVNHDLLEKFQRLRAEKEKN